MTAIGIVVYETFNGFKLSPFKALLKISNKSDI